MKGLEPWYDQTPATVPQPRLPCACSILASPLPCGEADGGVLLGLLLLAVGDWLPACRNRDSRQSGGSSPSTWWPRYASLPRLASCSFCCFTCLAVLGHHLLVAQAEVATAVAQTSGALVTFFFSRQTGSPSACLKQIDGPFQAGQQQTDCPAMTGAVMISPAIFCFQRFLAGLQVEAGDVVRPVLVVAIGIGHEDLAAGDGGHAHERIAQPFLPDRLAVQGEDFQLAATRC